MMFAVLFACSQSSHWSLVVVLNANTLWRANEDDRSAQIIHVDSATMHSTVNCIKCVRQLIREVSCQYPHVGIEVANKAVEVDVKISQQVQ